MNDWVVETPLFEEDLMNNRVVMLNQVGVNRVVEIIKEKDKEIEKLREENLLLRASEPMSKLQEDYGYKAEVEKLNRLISQKEQKWEKWTTEKQILSSKMSDYLCKYQNIKREYTKQIKISTDRKKEIERLENIIKEAREYIKEACWLDEVNKPNSLGHKQTMKVLEILDKGE